MSLSEDTAIVFDRAAELKLRSEFFIIRRVPQSQLPYRVERRRNGSIDRACATLEEAQAFILGFDMAKLTAKVTRKGVSGRRPYLKKPYQRGIDDPMRHF